MEYTITLTIRKQLVKVSGTIEEIATKLSKFAGFTLTPEDIIKQGAWSVVYRKDYQASRPRKTSDGEVKESISLD